MTTISNKVDWTLFSNGEIENLVDKGFRHKAGKTHFDYLQHWLFIGRQFAFATQDDSYGEFEKLFSIMVSRMVSAERKLKALGIDPLADN